jgi:predicted dehydrogenase
LAEKPIAKDISTAQELLSWTQDSSNTTAIYTVAENFRFIDSYVWASEQIASLGRILTFRVRVAAMIQAGSKYYETAWRKKPEYQGGFLLDGGVHFIAATRLLLQGGGQKIKTVSAFTTQLQDHLPPVDTLNSTMQLDNGSSGTFSVSFGTTDTGSEYLVACEKGSVHVTRGKVTITKDGKEETKDFPDEGNGVNREIKAWAESLEKSKRNEMQSPEEAVRDLEILECCLRSGEQGGKPMDVKQ